MFRQLISRCKGGMTVHRAPGPCVVSTHHTQVERVRLSGRRHQRRRDVVRGEHRARRPGRGRHLRVGSRLSQPPRRLQGHEGRRAVIK